MKKLLLIFVSFVFFSQLSFSQSDAGLELQKKGSKSKWKWVKTNNYKKAVVLEIQKTLTDCDGKTTVTIIKRTVYSTIGKKSEYFDDYGHGCSGSNFFKKEYKVISSKFKKQ